MSRMIYDYTKGALERASLDQKNFMRELRKALKKLLPHELEHLKNWLVYYTDRKPELKPCLSIIQEINN
jgi:hypothetical protein